MDEHAIPASEPRQLAGGRAQEPSGSAIASASTLRIGDVAVSAEGASRDFESTWSAPSVLPTAPDASRRRPPRLPRTPPPADSYKHHAAAAVWVSRLVRLEVTNRCRRCALLGSRPRVPGPSDTSRRTGGHQRLDREVARASLIARTVKPFVRLHSPDESSCPAGSRRSGGRGRRRDRRSNWTSTTSSAARPSMASSFGTFRAVSRGRVPRGPPRRRASRRYRLPRRPRSRNCRRTRRDRLPLRTARPREQVPCTSHRVVGGSGSASRRRPGSREGSIALRSATSPSGSGRGSPRHVSFHRGRRPRSRPRRRLEVEGGVRPHREHPDEVGLEHREARRRSKIVAGEEVGEQIDAVPRHAPGPGQMI